MPMPGAGDSYFYEWYVGLENVIKMINPDSGIKHVVFQHDEYDTIDDVVVTYSNGSTQICYQVKHNIGTAAPNSLTFGSMLETPEGKKCLFEAMYQGWKKATTTSTATIFPVLFTNRRILNRRARRHLNGTPYNAYPVNDFVSKMQIIIQTQEESGSFVISDDALRYQWEELCSTLSAVERTELMAFIKHFRIEGNQPSLGAMKQSLIDLIAQTFSCNDGEALDLFGKLLVGLTEWTTTERKNRVVVLEDVYSVLSIEADIDDSQHRLAHPFPFFESRRSFCETLVDQIKTTNNKVVFISGNPGSGKTSVVSFIQSEYNLFSLRYHTFRPISPEQRFYNTDPGMCTPKNLWGTLLTQLRKKLKGHLAEYDVPVSNNLIAVHELRTQVLRLLRILAQAAVESDNRIYICIDGIDHAARANTDVSFLGSLPTPEEIPEGVCFIIVGQPTTMYQDQYPLWLSTSKVIERVDMPLLNIYDIKQLILSRTEQFIDAADELANLIYQKTEGNNLSAVFAVEEIRSAHSLEQAVTKLQESGICGNIQQYYNNIWTHMKHDLAKVIHAPVYPESIVACPLLLLNGRVNTRILAQSLNYGLSQNDWSIVLDRLFPLIIRTDVEDEYALFHNDFRVFLMEVIQSYQLRYKEIALALAEYLLQNDEGLLSYTMGITLLQCAERQDLIPTYFTPEFVIDALAEGVSKTRLDEFVRMSYDAACVKRDYVGYRNTYLSVKTLYQHKRYYDYYEKVYKSADNPELSAIDISEIRSLPVAIENIDIFSDVLTRCAKLFFSDKDEYKNRALALYHKWFDGLSPLSFIPFLPDNISEENAWEIKSTEIGLFFGHWGNTAARLNIPLIDITEQPSSIGKCALSVFGNQYFSYSIEQKKYKQAIDAIATSYVTKQALAEKLEDIYYSGTSVEFDRLLTQIDPSEDKPAWKLLALSMKTSFDVAYIPDHSVLTEVPKISHVYDEASFVLVLKAFLLGRMQYETKDEALISLSDEMCSSIEDNHRDREQVSYLARVAVLLGKYYWNDAPDSSMFEGYSEWLLIAKLHRTFDYSKARRFLIFTLLNSRAGEALGEICSFIDALRTNLFEVDHLGMYYKTDLLAFLAKRNRLDIINDYIGALYGENCCEICKDENMADVHDRFRPYGELVKPETISQFTNQLKWDVVGYSGHKEYAMYAPLECYQSIIESNPFKWEDLGKRLYQQSLVADLANNRASYDIYNTISKTAACCGVSDYWRLRAWDDSFRLDPNRIAHSLYGFINNAAGGDDLKAIWILCCGLNSWYTQEGRQRATNIYKACLKRAETLNVDFASTVLQITPQWMSIVSYCLEKNDEINDHTEILSKRSEEKNAIRNHYDSVSVDESLDFLLTIETSRWVDEHYSAVLDKMLKCAEDTQNNLNKYLRSFSIYLQDKSWTYEKYDEIICQLMSRLGDDAFWSLAESIGIHLADYDYQESTRNMQLLFKLKGHLNCSEMESLFKEELRTQELWTTGNGHLSIGSIHERPQIEFADPPKALEEMALYILLEQIDTQNARKIESAIYGIYLLGVQFPRIMDFLIRNWKNISTVQEETLLIIITKWGADGICSPELYHFLRDLYSHSRNLIQKYYLHSILLRLHDPTIHKDKILCEASSNGYDLPLGDIEETESYYENFLSMIERCGMVHDAETIRRCLFELSPLETYTKDSYGSYGDCILPTISSSPGEIFYDQEKAGNWNSIPLSLKKAFLLPIEDPFLVTSMPDMIFDSNWFDNENSNIHKSPLDLCNIAHYNIGDKKIVIAASLWLPQGNKGGLIYDEFSKISLPDSLLLNEQFDTWVGNYGLLIDETALVDIAATSCDSDEISLFNRIGGIQKLCFGNCQWAPSFVWQAIFECVPLDTDPYIWVDQTGKTVLHFERIASPSRDAVNEMYIRQPILFRWVCDEEWLKGILYNNGLCLHICNIQESYPNFP